MRLRAKVGERTAWVVVRGKDGRYDVTVDDTPLVVDLAEAGDHFGSLLVGDRSYDVGIEARPEGYRVHGRNETVSVTLGEASTNGAARRGGSEGPERLTAPMP